AAALLLLHERRGRSELYRYDLAADRLTQLEAESGAIAGARVRPDGELWYAWTRSSSPPEIRADGRTLLRPPGDPAPGGVAYREHQVGDVPLFLAEPPGTRPHRTIFVVHGGPHSHVRDSFSPQVQAWVDQGY